MTDEEMASKEALKKLRAERKGSIDKAKSRIKETTGLIKQISAELKDGGKTIPELAEKTGVSTADALWYVSTLRKYGMIAEGPKEGSYFKYELTKQD
jgi:predicted transcriptional regulator